MFFLVVSGCNKVRPGIVAVGNSIDALEAYLRRKWDAEEPEAVDLLQFQLGPYPPWPDDEAEEVEESALFHINSADDVMTFTDEESHVATALITQRQALLLYAESERGCQHAHRLHLVRGRAADVCETREILAAIPYE